MTSVNWQPVKEDNLPSNLQRVLVYQKDWIPEIKEVVFFDKNPNDRTYFLEQYSHWTTKLQRP